MLPALFFCSCYNDNKNILHFVKKGVPPPICVKLGEVTALCFGGLSDLVSYQSLRERNLTEDFHVTNNSRQL